MARNVLPSHNRNPYNPYKNRKRVVIFSAQGYCASQLMIISPIALKVMIALATRLNDEGYALATLDDLAKDLFTHRSYVNKGILELANRNLISKKKRGEYWIRPDAFRPALIEVGY